MTTTAFVANSTAIAATWLNDVDTHAYGGLTSVSGTNAVAATGPASMTAYAVNQVFRFVPAGTNTGATTLNITPSGASALGAKNVYWNGAACVGGEIRINVPVVVMYDGTQFQIVGSASMVQVKGATLTANRIPYAVGSSGLVIDSANLTFDGTTLTANTIGAFTLSGTVSGGGNQINNVIIGTVTPLAGAFTTGNFSGVLTGQSSLSMTNGGVDHFLHDGSVLYWNSTGASGGTARNAISADSSGNLRMYYSVSVTEGFKMDASGNVTLAVDLIVGAATGGAKGAGTINAAGAYYANGTAGVASFGPAAVASITVKNGIITAIS